MSRLRERKRDEIREDGAVIEVEEEEEEEERQEEGFDLRKRGRTQKRGKEGKDYVRE